MVRFHIVNSVKGGCGKSTFSLFLANYLRQEEAMPIIIDLDICGSTWYSNNINFISDEDECYFINDMFYNANKCLKSNHIFKLNISDSSYTDSYLSVIMADSNRLTSMSDENLDLLESVVFKLVKELCSPQYDMLQQNKIDKLKKPVTDIIFDMPPGYEKHTEQIIRHLIMDMESKLYKELDLNPKVYIYMLSNVNEATFRANLKYVVDLFSNAKFSMNTDIIKPENIFFILNDINGIIEKSVVEKSTEKEATYLSNFKRIIDDKEYNSIKKCCVHLIRQMKLEYEQKKIQNMNVQTPKEPLQLGNAPSYFDDIFSKSLKKVIE